MIPGRLKRLFTDAFGLPNGNLGVAAHLVDQNRAAKRQGVGHDCKNCGKRFIRSVEVHE